MKITLLTPALVAILGLALAGAPTTAQAQTTTTTPDTTAPAPAKVKKHEKPEFKGSITAISATSVTVANKKKTLTLAITPKTTFKIDKAPATVTDFAVGDKVSGSYSTDASGAMSANSLHKKTPKPAAATTTAPATPAAN